MARKKEKGDCERDTERMEGEAEVEREDALGVVDPVSDTGKSTRRESVSTKVCTGAKEAEVR